MTNNSNVKKEKNNINKSNKGIIDLIAFTIMIVMASLIVSYYPRLQQISRIHYESRYEDHNLMEGISRCSMVLYKDILDKDISSYSSVTDTFIKSYDEDKMKNNDDQQNIENTDIGQQFDEKYKRAKTNLKNNYKNLDYAVLDKDGNVLISNTEINLKDVLTRQSLSTEELNNYYGFYIVVNYDNNGKGKIVNSYGIEDKSIKE